MTGVVPFFGPRTTLSLAARALRPVLVLLILLSFTGSALAGVHRTHAAAARGSAAMIVSLAQGELARNVHEIPDGSNRSPDIWRYDRATAGSLFGAPWCAYFASYVARQAGVPLGYHGEGIGYVPYIRDWARATGRVRRTPKPGYLITFPEHVGIVEHVYANHTLSSIEGNAGNAVRREYHSWGEAVDYVQIASSNAAPAPEPASSRKPAATTVSGRLVARIHAYPDTTVGLGQAVEFSSEDSSGNPAREEWSFGEDGRWDARGQSASHAWTKAGSYTVRLRLTDRRGHHSVTTTVVTVHPLEPPHPVLSLDRTTIHPGDTIHMSASGSSDPNGGDIVAYEWDSLGNGNFVQGPDRASYPYSTPGTYTVRLRITDENGLQAEADRTVVVAPFAPPVARISCGASQIVTGQTLYCSSDDSRSPYSVTSHQWDMNGDGSYDLTGRSVSFRYTAPGTYRIHLRVTDAHGTSAETDAYVHVADSGPTARLTPPASVLLNTAATFDGSGSSDPDGQGLQYQWDAGLGAGYQPGGSTFTATYTQPGWYEVKLLVTDGAGMTSSKGYWFYVRNHAPVAALTASPTTPLQGAIVSFDGSQSSDPDPGDTIAKYEWDFLGNGTWVTGSATATYAYATPGTYYAKLRVTDRYGVSRTAQVTIVVG